MIEIRIYFTPFNVHITFIYSIPRNPWQIQRRCGKGPTKSEKNPTKKARMRGLWVQGLLIAHLCKAFTAIDRFVVFRDKGYFRLRAAFCANGAIAYFFAVRIFLCSPAFTTPNRIIQESFFCENSCSPAVNTNSCPQSRHTSVLSWYIFFPRFDFLTTVEQHRLTWSLSPHPPAGRFAPKAFASPLLPLSGILHLTDAQPKFVFPTKQVPGRSYL